LLFEFGGFCIKATFTVALTLKELLKTQLILVAFILARTKLAVVDE